MGAEWLLRGSCAQPRLRPRGAAASGVGAGCSSELFLAGLARSGFLPRRAAVAPW